PVLTEAERIIAERMAQPTMAVNHTLPPAAEVASVCETLGSRVAAVNGLIAKHNAAAADFENSQSAAREGIKKHFLADGNEDYRRLETAVAEAKREADTVGSEVRDLRSD